MEFECENGVVKRCNRKNEVPGAERLGDGKQETGGLVTAPTTQQLGSVPTLLA